MYGQYCAISLYDCQVYYKSDDIEECFEVASDNEGVIVIDSAVADCFINELELLKTNIYKNRVYRGNYAM